MIEASWILKDTLEEELPDDYSYLPRIVQHLLKVRGLKTDAELDDFLNPRLKKLSDPFIIGEVQAAVELIFAAIDAGKEITLFGDYDVDGITSVSLLCTILQGYDVYPNTLIPMRGAEGYGLTDKAVDRLLDSYPSTELLITMDCGTSSIDQIRRIRDRGIEVIVLDHHEPNTDERPACNVIVNPKACFTPNLSGDYSYLCAAGVVFKVCHALMKTRMIDSINLKSLLDLVAVATVADIVPLVGENRILVRHGLRVLANTDRPGLVSLKKVAGVPENPEASDIGFKIGPRINAAGRMDAPLEALETILTDCKDQAEYLVSRLNQYNIARQNYEKKIQQEAYKLIEENALHEKHCIIVGKEGWHPGVVGIVASRIMRKFFKPCFVVAFDENGEGKASGRSLNNLSLVEAIESGRDLLIAGGGHHAAAGLTITRDYFAEFCERVHQYFEQNTTPEDRAPRIMIDADVDFQELSFSFLDSYDKLKPFGAQNPQPVFMSRGVTLARPPQELKNNHLKLCLSHKGEQRDAMFFSGAEAPLPPEPWDVCYTVERNIFRGNVSLQITIRQLRTAR